MASASASAASGGRGGSEIRSSLVTMVVTWSLSARPFPVTAALTSLGGWGAPRLAGPRVGLARVQPLLDLGLDGQQPRRDVVGGRGPDHPDPDQAQRPAR